MGVSVVWVWVGVWGVGVWVLVSIMADTKEQHQVLFAGHGPCWTWVVRAFSCIFLVPKTVKNGRDVGYRAGKKNKNITAFNERSWVGR